MKILVFNCGSSSLKYRLLDMPTEVEIAGGEAQHVGPPTIERARIVHRNGKLERTVYLALEDQAAAFKGVIELLASEALRPDIIAHRLVHGGERFTAPTLVNDHILKELIKISPLAPLHNPPAIALIEACRRRLPRLPQAVVFDTAFHATIPPYAREYALPRKLTAELGIRKYGFHGSSHEFVMEEAARFIGKSPGQFNAVSCHLGSGGASLCAIVNGKSVDNTMGFSPLQGLVMSTRCGDLDPAIVMNLLAENLGDGKFVERILNKTSGVLGLSGLSSDIRDVLGYSQKTPAESTRLEEAAQVYLWRIHKYLGAYLAVVGRTDAIIFTDTIGETVPFVRWAVCSGLEYFGVAINNKTNFATHNLPFDVSASNSSVKVLVIQTNEELAIARRIFALVRRNAVREKASC